MIPMIHTGIRLSEDLLDRLKQAAKVDGVAVSTFIRRVLEKEV